jgi:cytochrome c6
MVVLSRGGSSALSIYFTLLMASGFFVVDSTEAFGVPDPTTNRRLTTLTPKIEPAKVQRAFPTTALVAAALVASASLGSPVPSNADADVAHGAALFKAECAGCHLGGNNFMSEKKTLKKDALQQYQSLDSAKLQAFVQNQMPHSFLPFHSKWSDQDFADAVGYVLDQAVSDKWE